MERNSRNIYKYARDTADMSQEAWAEAIGVSADSVRNYEAGRQVPGDEVVKAMIEISGLTPLKNWHLQHKSTLAGEVLPEVEWVPVAQAVCAVCAEIRSVTSSESDRKLLDMAADGRIDELEFEEFQRIMERLRRLARAIYQLEYSRKGGEAADGRG